MRYVEFRDVIEQELRRNPQGLTWMELKESLNLPYDRPCATWLKQMEAEIGLCRERGGGRAFVWRL